MATHGKSRWILLLLFAALAAAAFFTFRDTTAPTIRLTPDGGALNAQTRLTLQVEDPGSGLRYIKIRLRSGDQERVLVDRQFDVPEPLFQQEIDPAAMRPAQGPLEVIVSTGDRSFYRLGKGNEVEQHFSFTFDSRPPEVAVLSQNHNISQGGAGLIVFTLNEDVRRCGVTVGDHFFPASHQEGSVWACLFPFPYTADPDKDAVRLLAEDEAGNIGYGKFYYHIRRVRFPSDRITLTSGFLENIRESFAATFPDKAGDPLNLFLEVNRALRTEDRAQLPKIGTKTSPRPLFHGAFERQPGRRTGAFADHRTYFYQGRQVDRQVHLGIDIASTSAMPIHAANAGTVAWADTLGIYGNCVIIDHGLGLQSLYGHLSRIDVTVGQTLKKGEIIGRSGATGIAGGDHLHFGILIHGVPSDPVEWWDPHWVKEHIEQPLALRP